MREDFLEEARLSKEKQVTPGGRAEQAEFRCWGDMNGGGGGGSLAWLQPGVLLQARGAPFISSDGCYQYLPFKARQAGLRRVSL